MFTLSPLPYATDALEPHISARTLEFHHGKHHKSYVDKLNAALDDLERDSLRSDDLLELVQSSDGHLYNMAAQVWNHTFYWHCLTPGGGGEPPLPLRLALENAFGSVNNFVDLFREAATGTFGSGWAWLVQRESGSLHVTSTPDAENPARRGDIPLLTLDVWEHAYYLDYQNRRGDYIDAFFSHLIDWQFVNANLIAARDKQSAA